MNESIKRETSSHLSTIISRVKNRLKIYDNDPARAGKDPLFKQSIENLIEYIESWDDYTPEEKKEAEILYARYYEYVRDKKRRPI